MNDRFVTHATFTLERVYPAAPARVFAAWADPAAKARWFAAPGGEHELDFRVGDREVNRGRHGDGPLLTFESRYEDIVPDERIVYSSTLRAGETLSTVSLTTVELGPAGDGTRDPPENGRRSAPPACSPASACSPPSPCSPAATAPTPALAPAPAPAPTNLSLTLATPTAPL
jgi:uncharacterized protein YndB with AHSA1/START domain